jgi:cysteine desulfurase
LDYNGTISHDPEVVAAMWQFLKTDFGNPSSAHWYRLASLSNVGMDATQISGINLYGQASTLWLSHKN